MRHLPNPQGLPTTSLADQGLPTSSADELPDVQTCKGCAKFTAEEKDEMIEYFRDRQPSLEECRAFLSNSATKINRTLKHIQDRIRTLTKARILNRSQNDSN